MYCKCTSEYRNEQEGAFVGVGNGVRLGFDFAAKMWRSKGCCNLSRRVVASSGQLRLATAYCGLLRLAVAGCGWLQVAKVGQRLATAWPGMAKKVESVA